MTAPAGNAPRPTFSKPKANVASPIPVSAKPRKSNGRRPVSLRSPMRRLTSDDPQDPDRDVDKKDPAPRGVGDDKAAERRPHDRPDQRRDADIGHRAHEIGFLDRPQQHQAADRHHHRPAHPLHDPRHDESGERIGAAAADRAQGEDDDRGAEHPARAKPVGGPAADRDEDGKAQQIAGDRHIEPQRALVERAGDRRQCRRDHGRIEVLHEHRAGDDKRHQDRARTARAHSLI